MASESILIERARAFVLVTIAERGSYDGDVGDLAAFARTERARFARELAERLDADGVTAPGYGETGWAYVARWLRAAAEREAQHDGE